MKLPPRSPDASLHRNNATHRPKGRGEASLGAKAKTYADENKPGVATTVKGAWMGATNKVKEKVYEGISRHLEKSDLTQGKNPDNNKLVQKYEAKRQKAYEQAGNGRALMNVGLRQGTRLDHATAKSIVAKQTDKKQKAADKKTRAEAASARRLDKYENS